MSATASNTTDDPVAAEAAEALRKARGDVAKATKILAARVRADGALRRAILEPLIDTACSSAVQSVHRRSRHAVWKGAPGTVPEAGANARAVSQRSRVVALAADNLLMFPLLGGTPLGDAKRDDIIKASEFYSRQAKDMHHKGRWLALVAQSVPADKRARDVLTNKRLHELKLEAGKVPA